MPVIPTGSWLNPDNRPEWSGLSAVGRFTVDTAGARFERHHHDDDEIWLIWAGRAKILVDGAERYVQAGDIVLTRAGDPHDVLEVYETLRGFFVETGHPSGGRHGHLDPVPHDVPALPLPPDFPTPG